MPKKSQPTKHPLKRYQAFILDADNTLFDFDRAESSALGEALEANGYRDSAKDLYPLYHDINNQLWKLFERGDITQQELRTERFRRLLDSLAPIRHPAPRPDPGEIGRQYIEALSEKGFLLPHARSVLRSLAAKAPLLLLSNGVAAVQRRRIACSGIGRYFSDVLISAEVGLAKPDPAIFDMAIQKLRCGKQQILCVGDSPTSDILGGQSAGLDTCWYAPSGGKYPAELAQPLYRIDDLRQLLQFLPAERQSLFQFSRIRH